MEYDERLAADLLNGTGVPTLRLYTWQPWAISLGYNQNVAEIDVEQCASEGIDVVRRPTGGRAILHAEELTYAVAMESIGRSVLDTYGRISLALVAGLRAFGVNASLQRSQPDFNEEYKKPSAVPCFTSSARYEIEVRGKKLVGSAQRRFRKDGVEVVLQHGSILLGPAHRRLGQYLAIRERCVWEQVSRQLVERTIDLAEVVGRPVELEALKECVRLGFERTWGIQFSITHQYSHSHSHA